MANSNFVFGLRPVGSLISTGLMKPRRYFVPASDATAIFVGDAVKSAGSADASTGLPTVAQAAAGDTIRGVVVGVDQVDGVAIASTVLSRVHRPASTAMYLIVCDDPNAIFEVQEDAVGGTIALVDAGENADIVVGSGNATTGLSGMQLDSSTHTTGSAQLRILGWVQRPDNEVAVANAKLLVTINEHELKGTAGV